MEKLGYQEGVESDHELHWMSKCLHVELHKRVIPSYNDDYYTYFGDGWKLAASSRGTCWEMTPEDEFVYIFTHFAKHYRDGGIGFRQVTDLWVYRNAHPDLDEAVLRSSFQKLQMLPFYENMRAVLDMWFGDAPWTERGEFIINFIFDSGAWGKADNHILSSSIRQKAVEHKKDVSRTRHFLRLVFPSRSSLLPFYPWLEHLPVLLPLAWIMRGFRVLFFQRGKIDHQIYVLNTMTPDRIHSYEDALHYVGLDFHFNQD